MGILSDVSESGAREKAPMKIVTGAIKTRAGSSYWCHDDRHVRTAQRGKL